jgi:hypothetical protein
MTAPGLPMQGVARREFSGSGGRGWFVPYSTLR